MPVVIVATEEGLAAVPRIVREGSFAMGATKFETTWRVVIPAAAPGILTGLILAMARAAGEVAPLMIVGMVKLAPAMPIDGNFPFLHFERKFMHLGFHIYDVGFQSPNVDATKPLVFATAFLLILIVTVTESRGHLAAQSPAAQVCGLGRLTNPKDTNPNEIAMSPIAKEKSLVEPLALKPQISTRPDRDPALHPEINDPTIRIVDLNFWYGSKHALESISLEVEKNKITAFIGPSGCGKSTLLRCINRMNDLVDEARVEGKILFDGDDIYDRNADVNYLRRRIGMVFQKSNPFPKSIYENVAYGPRIHGVHRRSELDTIVEKSLRGAALWDEVKDRLHDSALGLSGANSSASASGARSRWSPR